MCIHCVLGKVLICPDISKSSSDWTARSKALVIMPRKIRNFHYYDTMTTTYFPGEHNDIRVNVNRFVSNLITKNNSVAPAMSWPLFRRVQGVNYSWIKIVSFFLFYLGFSFFFQSVVITLV